MKNGDAQYDETESAGGSMIRLNFRAWIPAPPFANLDTAAIGEAESCDSLSPEGMLIERRALHSNGAPKFIKCAFSRNEDFTKMFGASNLLFFHVFEKRPDAAAMMLLARCFDHKRVILLDVCEDAGFLKNTPAPIASGRESNARTLADLRGIGAWGKAGIIGFEQHEAEMPNFIAKVNESAQAGK